MLIGAGASGEGGQTGVRQTGRGQMQSSQTEGGRQVGYQEIRMEQSAGDLCMAPRQFGKSEYGRAC